MIHHILKGRRWAAALLSAAAMIPGAGGMAMATPLAQPVEIEADFLARNDRSGDWLKGAMAGLGAPEGWSMTSDAIIVSELEALRALNRIRAFRRAVNRGTGGTWLLLPVEDEDGERRDCVTGSATQVIPDLDVNDFGQTFALSILRTDTPSACLIDPEAADPFADKDRDALRAYFDEAGDLKLDHVDLNTDPMFIRALIEAGYLVTVQSVTGRLRVL